MNVSFIQPKDRSIETNIFAKLQMSKRLLFTLSTFIHSL